MHAYRLRELIAVWERLNGRRLPLTEIADATGVSRTTLSKMMNPKGYVTNTRHIESLCRFFDVPPDELIYFTPPIHEAQD